MQDTTDRAYVKYVDHCLRFYAQCGRPTQFRISEVLRQHTPIQDVYVKQALVADLQAVSRFMESVPLMDDPTLVMTILEDIYFSSPTRTRSRSALSALVSLVADKCFVSDSTVYRALSLIRRGVAKERGLTTSNAGVVYFQRNS